MLSAGQEQVQLFVVEVTGQVSQQHELGVGHRYLAG
jgi:hypothetical protein